MVWGSVLRFGQSSGWGGRAERVTRRVASCQASE